MQTLAECRAHDCGAPLPCVRHNVAPWYRPHRAQVAVHRAMQRGARVVNICAGRRGGKTLCAAVAFVDRIYTDLAEGRARKTTTRDLPIWKREPALHYWVVAPESNLHKVAVRYVRKALPADVRAVMAEGMIGDDRGSPSPALWLPGDICIEFRSAKHPGTLVSEGLAGVWLTEAARLHEDVWGDNLMPSLEGGWVLTDTTPLGRNWYWEEFWRAGLVGDERHSAGVTNVTWATEVNPTPRVQQLVRDARDAVRRGVLGQQQYDREYRASFDAYKGQVYAFVRGEHVFSGPVHADQYAEVIGGFDWGRDSPACLLLVGVRHGGGYDVIYEDYGSERLAATWIREAHGACRLWTLRHRGAPTIFSDPSNPILPDMQDAGVPIEAATERSVLAGIERVAGLLAQRDEAGVPLVRVHERCANLIREMPGYRWRETQTGRSDEPIKRDDHALDALRYALASHSRGPAVWGIE